MAGEQGTTLGDAVARYVQAAMPIASANLQPGELIGFPGGGRWKATGSGMFQREDEVATLSWVIVIDKRKGQLHALPEYQKVVAVVDAHEEWRGQFGTLVGTWHSRTRLDIDWFLNSCLSDALSAHAAGRDAVAAALERVARIEQFLEARELTVEILGPLYGFNAAGVGRIELSPGIALEPIGEAEVGRLYSFGLLQPLMPGLGTFVNAPSHLVRSTYRTAKVIGEMDTADALKAQALADEAKPAEEAIEDLLACLRLLKPGQVGLGGMVTVMPSHTGGASWSGSSARTFLPPYFHHSYQLGAEEVNELSGLWHQLHSTGIRHTRHLALATRRFAYKGDRTRSDDQLVDLMVAAEALFLGDIDERGELRFRLSSRAASYIQDSTQSKRSIYELFLAAYAMRSKLLHGQQAKAMNVEGRMLSLEQMVEMIDRLLRLGLRQAAREAAQGSTTWKVDWDGLLFPGSELTLTEEGGQSPTL